MGDRREVTILMSDLRGFTALAERTPPEHVLTALNEYLGVDDRDLLPGTAAP
jgi:adenylate cyclase